LGLLYSWATVHAFEQLVLPALLQFPTELLAPATRDKGTRRSRRARLGLAQVGLVRVRVRVRVRVSVRVGVGVRFF